MMSQSTFIGMLLGIAVVSTAMPQCLNAAESVENSQVELSQLNLSRVPVVNSAATVRDMYVRVRDAREWRWAEMRDFPRRLTWLYPADGCYLRAELMVEKFRQWGYVVPAKIFVFGDLSFTTPYEEVQWWYHVAPVVRSQGQLYVIDPSLDLTGPLPLGKWMEKLRVRADTAKFAVCAPGAVTPDDDCAQRDPQWAPQERDVALQDYLQLEWDQLESLLRRRPDDVLGDAPPWVRPLPRPEGAPVSDSGEQR